MTLTQAQVERQFLGLDGYFSPVEVAYHTGRSPAWVRDRIRDGTFPSIPAPAGRGRPGRLVPAEAVQTYMAEAAERERERKRASDAAILDAVIRRLAEETVEAWVAEGVLPKRPPPAVLARIARAIRTASETVAAETAAA